MSLNLLADVDPERPAPHGLGPQAFHGTQGLAAIFKTWNGAAYSPDFGPYGAMIYYGGGHFGYYGSQVSLFDLGTRLWTTINQPVVLPGAKNYRDYDYDYSADTGSTYWRDHPEIVDLQYHDMYGATPEVQHTYDGVVHLPPAHGGGPKGSLLVRARGHQAMHRCDLATGAWSRFSEPSAHSWRGGGTGSACFDPVRNRIWYEGAGLVRPNGSGIEYLDLRNKQWKIAAGLNRNIYQYRTSHFWAARNAWISLCTQPQRDGRYAGLQVLDLDHEPASWSRVNMVTLPGKPIRYEPGVDWPAIAGAGIDFCELDECFYIYEGQGRTHIWRLEPPAGSIGRQDWRLSKQDISGDKPVFSGQSAGNGGLVLSRWRYAARLRCFVWADHPQQAVQLWRPAGAA